MRLLEKTCAAIEPRNKEIEKTIFDGWREITVSGSYGSLPEMVAQYGAVTGEIVPNIPKRCMIIAAADHGVAEMGVSAYPQEVTVHMTKNYLLSKGAGANALGNYCGADLEVVDVGIAADMTDVPGLRHHKVAYGTQNFSKGWAMTKEQAIEAMEVGISLVKEKVNWGYKAFLVGEMGIANTTAAAVMVAKFAGLTAEQATGRGTNISDERLKVKQKVVFDTLTLHKQISSKDGLGVLAAMGGLEFACLTGVILGAAAEKALVVIDGFNTTACSLVAHALAPFSTDYIMASHLSAEKAHTNALTALGLRSYVDLGLCLGEASGGSIQMEMLDLAIRMYKEGRSGI